MARQEIIHEVTTACDRSPYGMAVRSDGSVVGNLSKEGVWFLRPASPTERIDWQPWFCPWHALANDEGFAPLVPATVPHPRVPKTTRAGF